MLDWLDYDGHPRIIGDHVDMGALEYPVESATYATVSDFVRGGKWNLVSIPVAPVDPDPLKVFAGIDLANASFQFWVNNPIGSMQPGFEFLNPSTGWTGPVMRGVPYWFIEPKATTDKTISLQGYPSRADFRVQLDARPSPNGAPYWIMFGTPFSVDVPAANLSFTSTAVSSDPKTWSDANRLKLVESKALGFDTAAQQYFTLGPSDTHPDRTNLQPWFGYWLLVDTPDALTINFRCP
jgi:hypothetical protein